MHYNPDELAAFTHERWNFLKPNRDVKVSSLDQAIEAYSKLCGELDRFVVTHEVWSDIRCDKRVLSYIDPFKYERNLLGIPVDIEKEK